MVVRRVGLEWHALKSSLHECDPGGLTAGCVCACEAVCLWLCMCVYMFMCIQYICVCVCVRDRSRVPASVRRPSEKDDWGLK